MKRIISVIVLECFLITQSSGADAYLYSYIRPNPTAKIRELDISLEKTIGDSNIEYLGEKIKAIAEELILFVNKGIDEEGLKGLLNRIQELRKRQGRIVVFSPIEKEFIAALWANWFNKLGIRVELSNTTTRQLPYKFGRDKDDLLISLGVGDEDIDQIVSGEKDIQIIQLEDIIKLGFKPKEMNIEVILYCLKIAIMQALVEEKGYKRVKEVIQEISKGLSEEFNPWLKGSADTLRRVVDEITKRYRDDARIAIIGYGGSRRIGHWLKYLLDNVDVGLLGNVVVPGDPLSSKIEKDDLSISISLSGETAQIIEILGYTIDEIGTEEFILFTGKGNSTAAEIVRNKGGIVVSLPGRVKRKVPNDWFARQFVGEGDTEGIAPLENTAQVYLVFLCIVLADLVKVGIKEIERQRQEEHSDIVKKVGGETIDILVDQIRTVRDNLDDGKVDQLLNILKEVGEEKRKLVFSGAGRSGLIAGLIQSWLNEIGIEGKMIYQGDETIARDFGKEKKDTLLAISGSGKTPSITTYAKNMHKKGATVVGITANKEGKLAKLAGLSIIIRGRTKEDWLKDKTASVSQRAPLGTLFELSSYIFFLGVIQALSEDKGSERVKEVIDYIARYINDVLYRQLDKEGFSSRLLKLIDRILELKEDKGVVMTSGFGRLWQISQMFSQRLLQITEINVENSINAPYTGVKNGILIAFADKKEDIKDLLSKNLPLILFTGISEENLPSLAHREDVLVINIDMDKEEEIDISLLENILKEVDRVIINTILETLLMERLEKREQDMKHLQPVFEMDLIGLGVFNILINGLSPDSLLISGILLFLKMLYSRLLRSGLRGDFYTNNRHRYQKAVNTDKDKRSRVPVIQHDRIQYNNIMQYNRSFHSSI